MSAGRKESKLTPFVFNRKLVYLNLENYFSYVYAYINEHRRIRIDLIGGEINTEYYDHTRRRWC